MGVLAQFNEKWSHPNYPPQKVTENALRAAEEELGITFPTDYRYEVLHTGLPSPTLALLSGLVDREVAMFDLSELASPEAMVEATRGWIAAGMPGDLVSIGSDSSGNQFCFNRADMQGPAKHSAAVFFWDHDFDDVERVSASFSEWIASYLGPWSDGLSYRDF